MIYIGLIIVIIILIIWWNNRTSIVPPTILSSTPFSTSDVPAVPTTSVSTSASSVVPAVISVSTPTPSAVPSVTSVSTSTSSAVPTTNSVGTLQNVTNVDAKLTTVINQSSQMTVDEAIAKYGTSWWLASINGMNMGFNFTLTNDFKSTIRSYGGGDNSKISTVPWSILPDNAGIYVPTPMEKYTLKLTSPNEMLITISGGPQSVSFTATRYATIDEIKLIMDNMKKIEIPTESDVLLANSLFSSGYYLFKGIRGLSDGVYKFNFTSTTKGGFKMYNNGLPVSGSPENVTWMIINPPFSVNKMFLLKVGMDGFMFKINSSGDLNVILPTFGQPKHFPTFELATIAEKAT